VTSPFSRILAVIRLLSENASVRIAESLVTSRARKTLSPPPCARHVTAAAPGAQVTARVLGAYSVALPAARETLGPRPALEVAVPDDEPAQPRPAAPRFPLLLPGPSSGSGGEVAPADAGAAAGGGGGAASGPGIAAGVQAGSSAREAARGALRRAAAELRATLRDAQELARVLAWAWSGMPATAHAHTAVVALTAELDPQLVPPRPRALLGRARRCGGRAPAGAVGMHLSH